MIDIHTHILPGFDDGASDIFDSIEMAALARDSGTTVIVATPHCNIPGLYTNYFGKEYSHVFRETKEILKREVPEITLLAGMEVFATEQVPRLLTEGKIFPINRSYVRFRWLRMPNGMNLSRIIRKSAITGKSADMKYRLIRAALWGGSVGTRNVRLLNFWIVIL